MRAQLTDWNAYIARIEVAIELERAFSVSVEDPDLETMRTPLDFVSFIRSHSNARLSSAQIESEVVAVLSRVRHTSVGEDDLRREFTELFPVEEHP